MRRSGRAEIVRNGDMAPIWVAPDKKWSWGINDDSGR